MSEVISHNLEELVARAKDIQIIGPAPTPSGIPHLGTAMVLFYSTYMLSLTPDAKLIVTIMDTDFHWQMPNPFVPYTQKKSLVGDENLRDAFKRETKQVLEEFTDYFGIDKSRYSIRFFTEQISKSDSLKELINDLFMSHEGRLVLKKLLPNKNGKSTELISLTCPNCHLSPLIPPSIQGNISKYINSPNKKEAILKGVYHSPDCPEYNISLIEPGPVNFHYIMTALRYAIADEPLNFNIYGPDYTVKKDHIIKSKIDRIDDFLMGLSKVRNIPHLSEKSPIFYIGPLLTFQGDSLKYKLSKSCGDSFTTPKLRETYPDWVDRFYDLLTGKYANNSVIDLAEIPHFKLCK